MKKISLLLCVVVLILSLCGCSDEPVETETTKEVEESVTVDDVVNISFEKDEFGDYNNFIKEVEGYEGVEYSESDTNIVLTMNSDTYVQLLETKQKQAVADFDSLLETEGSYYEEFDYDDNFRNIKAYVNRELYDAAGVNTTLEVIKLGSIALAYQRYHVNGQNTIVSLMYSDDDSVIATVKLPAEMTQVENND